MAAKLIGERLPPNWSYSVSRDGRIFFIDDNTQQTTWIHPLTGAPVQTGYTAVPGAPPAWEQGSTIEGTVFYINHNRRLTTFDHPMSGHSTMESPTRSPPQSPLVKGVPQRKSSKLKNIKAPTASRGENSKVILRGWLQKQESGGLKLWKKKWCVLADFGLFFYKDEQEQNCIGSILLPSYSISKCGPNDVNKKHAFKAEHENMKTFYFAADDQTQMERWVEALRMAALVQRAPGSGHVPKLIPKSPIMSWDDDIDSPGIQPPDMQQFPFVNQGGHTPRSDLDNSFQGRSPLQARENTPNYGAPYQRQDSAPSSSNFGTLPREVEGQGHGSLNSSFDPRYHPDVIDRNRGSQRSNQGQRLPDDQRSLSSSIGQRSGQFSASTLPRDMKHGQPDNRSLSSLRGQPQGYNSLPRDQRSRSGEGHPGHQGQGHGGDYPDRTKRRKEDNNPYMTMMSPQNQSGYERKMDPMKHSNRPLPQEPTERRPRSQEPIHDRNKSGGGDYASLTRIRDKQHNLSGDRSHDVSRDSNQFQQQQQRPGSAIRPNQLSPPSQHHHHHQPQHQQQQQQQRGDLYVDIPHTYVNVYDESQVRGDYAPDLPSRPPLPVEVRHQIVEDIAKSHSPNTQRDLITAETNLEHRMKQPPFFNYPTPTQESLPNFTQDSPRSQYSQRSQRSHDRGQPEVRGQQQQYPRRPDLDHMEGQIMRQEVQPNSYQPPSSSYGRNINDSNLSNHLDGSDNTLTNEDDRNDKISEFYGLGKYNNKYGQNSNGISDKNRFMSDMDVRSNTLPSKPLSGVTGEKDFRLRSLPDHVQSMPALYHEQQPLSLQVPSNNEPVTSSYLNLSQKSIPNGRTEQDERKSAFRRLSASNSLQRIPSSEGHQGQSDNRGHGQTGDYRGHQGQSGFRGQGHSGGYRGQGDYQGQGQTAGDYNRSINYQDPYQTDVKRLSAASSQYSQPRPLKQDPPQSNYSGVQGRAGGQGQGHRGQGQKNVPTSIHTVKEDPDMPDSQIIETELPRKVFPLNGPRLRMSISATDLLGKTHDELVLLLIQLRRDKAELNEQRDTIRKSVEQNRPAEFYYRKLQNEGRPIDNEKEVQHRKYVEIKQKLEEVEKKLEVYKPLVNLVCNMVTMGSLYGGDNLMLATEYRKHLLSPEQYSPPKKMLEFSRRHQEDQVIQDMEEDVKQLTQEQADLEEKLNKLYDLDKLVQEQSFQVTNLKDDREMLERALSGLLKKQDEHCTNPRELDKLIQQQKTIEKELSRVLQQLAETSRELEETTAENNKVEHEVALLRSKVHGNVSRSKSAPSLSSESLRTKMKMEKDLARVKNIMIGLTEEGARLQEMMSTLRRPKSATSPIKSPLSPSYRGQDVQDGVNKSKDTSATTYIETDIDSGECKDLSRVTALLASYNLLPKQTDNTMSPEPRSYRSQVDKAYTSPTTNYTSPNSTMSNSLTGNNDSISPRQVEDDTTYRASLIQATIQPSTHSQLESSMEPENTDDQWDISDADDNTKRFYGLIPKSLPKQQTVRDVKRQSETRKESRKKDEDSPPLRVGVIPSDYNETAHVYENLPQQKMDQSSEQKLPWAALLKDDETGNRRRSNLHLVTPKPFSLNSKPTPYSSINNIPSSSNYTSQNIDQSDALLHNHNTQDSQSQPFLSDNMNNFEGNQSNSSNQPNEPITSQVTKKTPPPPPVRGTSRYLTADSAQLESLKEMFQKTASNRNYEPPVPAILKKGRNARNAQKGRYLTISSSEPVKLEQSSLQSPKLRSQAGDLISSMDVPDIVKSSTTKMEQYDDHTIDREILFFPEKVNIPERYIPDSDDESVTEEEKILRREKADKIKKILTQQSVHSLSQPDVSKVAGEVHERVQQEKKQRELLLGINQELAEQVKRKSRQFAAERRKTWSGSSKNDDMVTDHHGDDAYNSDANNNSYNTLETNNKESNSYPVGGDRSYKDDRENYYTDYYNKDSYNNNNDENDDDDDDGRNGDGGLYRHQNDDNRFIDRSYQPNFKI